MLVPSEAFSVRVEPWNGTAHLRLSGCFDDVTFMDGAAWLAVKGFEHWAHDWGKEVRLINTPPHVRRIFELTATEYLLSDSDPSTNGRHAGRTAAMR